MTARALARFAEDNGEEGLFTAEATQKLSFAKTDVSTSRNRELKELFGKVCVSCFVLKTEHA